MCGVAALVGRGGPAWPEARMALVERILSATEHRGMAGSLHETRAEEGTGVVLGVNRLPITSALDVVQPVWSPGGRFLLAFNGEVFDFREVAEQVGYAHDGADRPPSDTHVLAACLEAWGVAETVRRVDWEGAFVAVDVERRRVVAARDHLGIKPLYVASVAGGAAFSSEVKGLVEVADASTLRPVPPGGHEVFDLDGTLLESTVWWSAGEVTHLETRPEETEPSALLDALRASVHRRVPHDVPYAVALSGGLDSAAVLRLAVETGRRPHAFVLHRPGSPDLEHARRWASELEVPLTEVAGESGPMLRRRLAEVVGTVESWEWHVVNHAAPMMALTESIRRAGIRVVLSGEGADELFLGYGRVPGLTPRQEQVARLAGLHRTNCRRLDRMGMRDQLEFRVPFLERGLVELALRVPEDRLVASAQPKPVLREALRGLVPDAILERRKLSMARGAGYAYSADSPTVFETLPAPRHADHPLMATLPRYEAERVFLGEFLERGYERATYLLERTA